MVFLDFGWVYPVYMGSFCVFAICRLRFLGFQDSVMFLIGFW